ncbi:MAG: protein kinase [Thermoguttaceae bacterium]|nr:protein kinase [Thermoguttaceae bacterium]
MTKTGTCPSREWLISYALGTLPEEEANWLAVHLTACVDCAATLEKLEDVADSVIAGLRQTEEPSESEFLEELEFQEALERLKQLGPELLAGLASAEADLGLLPRMLGEYEVLERLGQGGMGTVYRARHLKLGKIVALKLLPKDRVQHPEARARFEREMYAVGQLEHPHIVRALDAREIEGRLVLVMEFVEGLNLQQLVRRLGPLPITEACELARQAAVALQFIHQRGLVHRDIKPSNLILTIAAQQPPIQNGFLPEGRRSSPPAVVKVVDLGLARLLEGFPNGKELTMEGRMMGTADYISPEQAIDSRKADPRSDLYSLGCTLYALLAGKPPFAGPGYTATMQKLTAHLRDVPRPIRELRPDVPEGLARIIERLMAKRPADRYATAAEVAEALTPFAQGANLAALLQQAKQVPSSAAMSGSARSSREVPTDPAVRSALVATDGQAAPAVSAPVSPIFLVDEARSSAIPSARPWPTLWQRLTKFCRQPGKPYWLKLAAALGPVLMVALILGVVITIRLRDGQSPSITVPDGSRVAIDQATGQVTVQPGGAAETPPGEPKPSSAAKVPIPPVSPPASASSELVVRRATPFTPEKPLRLVWQIELQRPWSHEVRRLRLTPDRRQLVVFHWTVSQRTPIERINSATGELASEQVLNFPGLMSVDGWVDQKGYLYLLGSGNRSFWKLSPDAREVIWRFTAGGDSFETVQSLLTDPAGFVYATGYCGSFYPVGSRAVKLDVAGTSLWENTSGFGKGTDWYMHLALDSQGNLFRGGRDNTDPKDVRKDRGRVLGHQADDGKEFFNLTLEEANSWVTGLWIDPEDNLYIACQYNVYETADQQVAYQKHRAVIQKHSPKGDLLWKCEFPEPGISLCRGSLCWFGQGLLVTCQKWSNRTPLPALALVSLDGKLRWMASLNLPGWNMAACSPDVDPPRIYLGLTHQQDAGLVRLLCLEVPSIPTAEKISQ